MDERHFEELKYRGAMLATLRQLLRHGLATPEEYHKIEGILSHQKRPNAKPQRNAVPIRRERARKEATETTIN